VKIRKTSALILSMVLVLLTNACQPLLEAPLEAQIPGLVHTLAVQTMAADQALRPLLDAPTQAPTQVIHSPTPTSLPGTATSTSLPTFTPLPSLTPLTMVEGSSQNTQTGVSSDTLQPANAKKASPVSVIQATAEPMTQEPVWIKGEKDSLSTNQSKAYNPVNEEGKLCNQVQFIQDVTIPDETPVDPGEEFTKIWQVKNIGTCTWTQDYKLIVVWGDEMGTRPPVPLGQVVQPGEIAEISMDMKAPYLPACYFTYWMMTDPQGNRFGTGSIARGNFWVSVSVTIPFLEKYVKFG
jgi:hypothetical protein